MGIRSFLFVSTFRHKYRCREAIIKRVMKMSGVIYADVLVVINVYITYLLLRSTALLLKENPDKLRLFAASLSGGFYSLTVLLPEKYSAFLVITRFFAAALFIFICFGFKCLKMYIRQCICFLFCSFIFAGLMLALWYFICPAGMYFNGAVVYFDIDILTLVVLTVVCYGFLKVFDRIFRTRAPVNTIYRIRVTLEGKEYELKAFLDTGNRLCDPFSGKPVIVANTDCFGNLFKCKGSEESFAEFRMHYIFCNTLGGKGMLPAFFPGTVHIKSAECDLCTDRIMLAVTREKLLQGEYDAILPLGIFDNNFERKDEGENEKAEADT